MKPYIENGLSHIIEISKMLLVSIYIWNIKPKKAIGIAFSTTLLSVLFVSGFLTSDEYAIPEAILIILIMAHFTEGKHQIALFSFSYLCISLVDMIFANFILGICPAAETRLQYAFTPICDSISLILLILYALISHRQARRSNATPSFLPVYITCVLALSIVFTLLMTLPTGRINIIQKYHNVIFIGLLFVSIFFLLVSIALERKSRENLRLKTENDMNQKLLEAQNNYYLMLLQKEAETKAFRHDINGQFVQLRALYEQGKYKDLGAYISQLQAATSSLSSKERIIIGNDYVGIIVSDLKNRYADVELEWFGILPELSLSYMDVCTLFYNLLKNAFEAAAEATEKWVKATAKVQGVSLFLCISNSYRRLNADKNGEFLSTKQGDGHGYGMANIKKCVERNSGSYEVTLTDNTFQTEIILPNAVKTV